MSSIWIEGDTGWSLLAPMGYPDEATLHKQVEEAPELLPLAGAPRLIVLGREVPLGGGYADLLAVEPSGRLALIEVKLARNAEARRAVVAQILGYAASLRGLRLDELEAQILRAQLLKAGVETIASLVEARDSEGSFDPAAFSDALEESLAAGRFRLVLVLDDAPPELVRLVGYVESIAPELAIDLVTVSAYEVNGTTALVPQRIDPERREPLVSATRPTATPQVGATRAYRISPEEFEASIDDAPEDQQPPLRRFYDWASDLERQGLVRLFGWHGTTGRTSLLPYPPDHDGGLITIWNDHGFYISLWRSVFEKRAPNSIAAVEAAIAPVTIGTGNSIRMATDALLDALRAAYREAAGMSAEDRAETSD